VHLAKGSLKLEGGIVLPDKEIGQAYQRKSIKCINVKYNSVRLRQVNLGPRNRPTETRPVYETIGQLVKEELETEDLYRLPGERNGDRRCIERQTKRQNLGYSAIERVLGSNVSRRRGVDGPYLPRICKSTPDPVEDQEGVIHR
jgi:hypothetical protein